MPKNNSFYHVKVKILRPPKKFTKYQNLYINGVVFAKTPTAAKKMTAESFEKYCKDKGYNYEIIEVKRAKQDFVIINK